MPTVKWNGDALKSAITAEMNRRLVASAIVVHNHAKELISEPGPSHSAPGEPPHMQMGHLRRSVAWEPGNLIVRVGTNVKYGRWLELGTGRIQARPWLRRALMERKDQLARLLGAKMF